MQIPSLQQLLEAGVHFGHQVRRGHPKMGQYIYGAREGVHVIDLTKSQKLLEEACAYVTDLGKSGGTLLLVGTKKQAQPIVEEFAKKIDAPYLTSRWIGGFLTNFEEIQKNVKKLKELKEQKAKGELSKYTKKEQLLIDRKVIKLESDLGGVLNLSSLPDALFIVDIVREDTSVNEVLKLNHASDKKISIVAITDSNSDPSLVDYPIPGNDDAIKSIKILVETITDAYGEGKKSAAAKASADKEAEVKKQKKDEEAAKKKTEKVEEAVIDKEIADEVAVVEEEVEKKEVKEAKREG